MFLAIVCVASHVVGSWCTPASCNSDPSSDIADLLLGHECSQLSGADQEAQQLYDFEETVSLFQRQLSLHHLDSHQHSDISSEPSKIASKATHAENDPVRTVPVQMHSSLSSEQLFFLSVQEELSRISSVGAAKMPYLWYGFNSNRHSGVVVVPLDSDTGQSPSTGLDRWDAFDTYMVIGMVVVLALYDFFINPRVSPCIFSHVLALGFMLVASAVFCIMVGVSRGRTDGVAWMTGFIVELALSMDNLFVFHLVFKAFSVPKEQVSRALSIGIYGAVCFRLVFILGLAQVMKLHYGVDVVIGIVLIISGLMSLQDDGGEDEVQSTYTVRFFKWLFGTRLQDSYSDDGSFFTRDASGKPKMTVLLLVVCVISVVDCIFAVDSVGSKTGQIKNNYLNITSCLMAMFCLRSLFFIVKDMVDYFDYVKYGICAILCFVGGEMLLTKWVEVPLGYMCVVIVFLFAGSVCASVAAAKLRNKATCEECPQDAANTVTA